MARTSNFTEAQKAQLYVLHRAVCVYSGQKLWILDSGARQNFNVDWADHIIPVAKGGCSTLENGVCASYFHNQKKRDSDRVPSFLFFKGEPQPSFFESRTALSHRMVRDLKKFAALHHSDWYFNRALFRVLLGVAYLHDGIGVRSRDDRYYASAALRAIQKWRLIVRREGVLTLEQRGLAPKKPSSDQRLLLAIRDAGNVQHIRRTMLKLLPAYRRR
ncbi:MAG: HNH endonuclease [Planctomycetaceae bacterium]|nr:HNH endonuclease [Planctomycetaceae bacterium]